MTDVNPYVVALFVVIVAGCLVSIVCARVAHRRTRDAWSAPAAFVAQLCGFVAFVAGLLAWAFDGYVEDYGMTPADTLDTAVELLSVAAILTAAAWFVALRPTDG
jgi:hypothetical protein